MKASRTSSTMTSVKNAKSRSSRPTLQNLNPLFHKREKSEDDSELSRAMLKQARTNGTLNLSGRGLSTVPEKVYEVNEPDRNGGVTLESLCVKEEDAWWNQVMLTSLDLSSNSLTTLSPKIQNLDSLTTLMLYDNGLVKLPKEIGKLEKLMRVNLSRNKLQDLPIEFYSLPDLRYLNISHNEFEELHPAISDLHMLDNLDASNNNIVEVPCGIGFLVRLTELYLSYNHIKELPADIVNMRSLKKLDLTHNDLKALPADMGCLRKLQFLYLQHNDIEELPKFEGCEELQELYAANNFISRIPRRLCVNLSHLKILDIRDNKLTFIPQEIALLQALTRLDISNNSITTLPYSLSSLAHLISLQVEGNPIKSIRRDILQCGTSRILKTLRERGQIQSTGDTASAARPTSIISDSRRSSNSSDELSARMVGDGLNSPRIQGGIKMSDDNIYPDRYKMRQTRSLTVVLKDLIDVPKEVFEEAAEAAASFVDLSRNKLTSLPEGLTLMRDCATELVFTNNMIESIPSFISQFTRISLINISSNRLDDLPEEFGLLATLRELNICNNRFEQLPPCVYELQGLEILLASDNRLQSIDATADGLGALKRLATLDLRNNDIEHVPPILGNLKNITRLELSGNPFRQPRHQILEKGTESIMSYLRDRIPQ